MQPATQIQYAPQSAKPAEDSAPVEEPAPAEAAKKVVKQAAPQVAESKIFAGVSVPPSCSELQELIAEFTRDKPLHPKVIELAYHVVSGAYESTNQVTIATLQAL